MSPPNQLTLLRILLTPAFVLLLFSDSPANKQLALLIFCLAAITDWYDGWVARRWGYVTRWGKFLDPLADKVLTSAAFISFIAIGYASAWMVWIIVVRDLLITFLRSYSEFKNKPVETIRFAQTKTFFQLVVIYLFLSAYIVRTSTTLSALFGGWFDIVASKEIMFVLMLVVTVLTAWTGGIYLVQSRGTIKELFVSNGRAAETGQSN
ncbi:MAG TPA: CDP-diacylglycerol--glycerol-3-phosphate 3-phosphatidyltransferase [Bacteroidota bacterium]|nr:CDP-diacylglycerol--glycerol-3-phosphate 3-phosphatidyltransferase [Bacteroidota bacterium]